MNRALQPSGFARTSFTTVLENLVLSLPEALCATFIDGEGETVDLATRIDPFDARIMGAETAVMLATLRASAKKLGQGPVLEIRLHASCRALLVRHVGEGYDLSLMLAGEAIPVHAAEEVATAVVALRTEAGLEPSAGVKVLRSVERRPSRAGIPVPVAFDDEGVRRRVVTLLGLGQDETRTAFLVRTDRGEEVMVVFDPETGRWRRG